MVAAAIMEDMTRFLETRESLRARDDDVSTEGRIPGWSGPASTQST